MRMIRAPSNEIAQWKNFQELPADGSDVSLDSQHPLTNYHMASLYIYEAPAKCSFSGCTLKPLVLGTYTCLRTL